MPWSAWIDNAPHDFDPATVMVTTLLTSAGISGSAPDGGIWETLPDVTDAAGDRATAKLESAHPALESWFAGKSGALNDFVLVKQTDPTGPNADVNVDFFYVNIVRFGQEMLQLDAGSPAPVYPLSYFDDHGLVEGVDYGPNPDTGQTVDFEGEAEFLHWTAFTFALHNASVTLDERSEERLAGFIDLTDATGWTDIALEYRWVPGFIVQSDGGDSMWQDFEAGTLLDTVTYPFSDLAPSFFGSGLVGTFDQDVSLDMSGVTEPMVMLFTQLNYMSDSVDQNFGPPLEIFGQDTFTPGFPFFYTAEMRAQYTNVWGTQTFPRVTPKARFQQPRWRYWIPDAIYTIGGHWSDPNGVVVKRLKDDGVTWIPIVDGLAPPLR